MIKKKKKSSPMPPCIQHVKFIAWLRARRACRAARYWVGDPDVYNWWDCSPGKPRSLKTMWRGCDHFPWMIWVLERAGIRTDLFDPADIRRAYPWKVVARKLRSYYPASFERVP
jgi:hypothetical protein